MRISPPIFRSLENFLLRESKRTNNPVVLLTHPNECIFEKSQEIWRSGGLTSFIRDNLRTRLKMKNLGIKAIKQLDETLNKAKKEFEFVSMETFSKGLRLENFRFSSSFQIFL